MGDIVGIRITPEPPPDERKAVLKAVMLLLEREAAAVQPSAWRVASWTGRRTGVRDFGSKLSSGRRWALSARLPWGGRLGAGLHGRGDAK